MPYLTLTANGVEHTNEIETARGGYPQLSDAISAKMNILQTTNFSMNNYKITNLANATDATDAINLGQAQSLLNVSAQSEINTILKGVSYG